MSKLDYLSKYMSGPPPGMGPPGLGGDKVKKKKKRNSNKTITVSHSTKIIDEGEDWVGKKHVEDDDELAPVMVNVVPMEERFKSDSFAVVREGEGGSSDVVAGGKRRRTPSPSPPPDNEGSRRRRRTPSASPPPNDEDDGGADVSSSSRKKKRMADGGTVGLQTADEMRKDLERRREQERRLAEDPAISGRDAPTVYRDRTGRKVNLEEQQAKDEAEREARRVEEEERYQFREGLAQKKLIEERLLQLEKEKTSSFAVYADDKERNDRMKEVDRWGDPLAMLGGSKKKKSSKQRYQGPMPPPNRYGIEPGYRWDGVDRGNGFEVKLTQARYSRQTRAEEAYKWSTE
ncbi:hypothetical protein HDU97_006291, partial [Phlyctochytrium planicorne]